MNSVVRIPVNIRRYDLYDEPAIESREIELHQHLQYGELRSEIYGYFNIAAEDAKVVKIRNRNLALIPMMDLLSPTDENKPFTIDVNKITIASESKVSLLQDAYIDAVKQKLKNMESRVSQAEVLLPQLQWRRQSHLDQTVNKLSTRVSFLNRRIDELLPPEWKSKIPETIS